MIKAEIKVGFSTYILSFPEAKSLEEAHGKAYEIAVGRAIYDGPEGWLDLAGGKYDHIRVYHAVDTYQPETVPQGSQEEAAANPSIDDYKIRYLGQDFKFTSVLYQSEDGTYYLLPYKISEQPAISLIGREGLESLCKQYAAEIHIPAEQLEIVIPYGEIPDDQEALAFIMDYAVETEIQRERLLQDTDKTAKAFTWKQEKE